MIRAFAVLVDGLLATWKVNRMSGVSEDPAHDLKQYMLGGGLNGKYFSAASGEITTVIGCLFPERKSFSEAMDWLRTFEAHPGVPYTMFTDIYCRNQQEYIDAYENKSGIVRYGTPNPVPYVAREGEYVLFEEKKGSIND